MGLLQELLKYPWKWTSNHGRDWKLEWVEPTAGKLVNSICKEFHKHYGSGYTPNELLRMELAILDKLHWDLYIGTPLDFVTIFHTLVVLGWPHVVELLPQRNPSLHVASLTRQLQHCMAGHQLLQFKGSTLALVIITLEPERLMPDWCAPISDLLKKAQLTIEQLSCCKELVKQQLRSF
ncbi:Cyclin-I2 [Manis pentadactyla]|nr:Cyclin-I2 [Manis pentadactyla]